MSPIVRQRTADAVAEHITEQLLDGRLRGGARIDVDAVAQELGVSRAPVREALAQLERDGLVTQSFHRRAFVSRFDSATVGQAFELYALLNGWASGKAAARHDPAVLATLEAVGRRIADARTPLEMEEHTRSFRRVLNVSVAGPHLRALLRSFAGLIPAASRLAVPSIIDDVRRDFRDELDAHRAGDARGAAAVAAGQGRRIGREAVSILQQRGILDDAPPAPAWGDDDLLAAIAEFS